MEMQTGAQRSTGNRVQIRRLETPPPRPGMAWVAVAAEYETERAVLVGAVPQSAAGEVGR